MKTKDKGMNHQQCRERRAAVVADVHAGMSRDEAAAKHGLSPRYVRQFERGPDIAPRRQTRSSFVVLAGLLCGETRSQVADRLACSRQYVQQVVAQAEAAGIRLPKAVAP